MDEILQKMASDLMLPLDFVTEHRDTCSDASQTIHDTKANRR